VKKFLLILSIIVAFCSGITSEIFLLQRIPFFNVPSAHAFETMPANFVVIDRTGEVTNQDMRGWIQMVKMDYHIPYYRLSDDNTRAVAAVQEMFSKTVKPDKEAMAEAAKNAECTALVVLVVRRMDEYMVRNHSYLDPETYVRTFAYADMYAYNANGNKFIRRFLREANQQPAGLEEHPSDTIKWTLGNLLNKMEGKPQI